MNIIKKEASTERSYDMRAQPRRRPKEENEQPLFLKKAFSMIDTCPSHLGGWSEKGDTFIVKDVKNFSELIIPTVFKHNNFSSFVRQLNFYGFRKIKSELYNHNSQWWEFRHPHFMRGQPELLSEIKRALHYAAPQDQTLSAHEVDTLKATVAGISDRVAEIDGSITGLTQLVSDLLAQSKRGHDSETSDSNGINKRRRLPSLLSFRIQNSASEATPYTSGSDDNYDELSESYSVSSEEPSVEVGQALPRGSELQDIELLKTDFFRMSSGDLLDDDLCIQFDDYIDLHPTAVSSEADLLNIRTKREPHVPYRVPSPATIARGTSSTCSSQSAIADIPDIMKHLSVEMQERFVDKLAESVGSSFAKLLASSVPSQAVAAVIPSVPAMSMNNYSGHYTQQVDLQMGRNPRWSGQREVFSSGSYGGGGVGNAYGDISPNVALPLASAALYSFLAAHCSSSSSINTDCVTAKAASQAASMVCNSAVCNSYSQSANV